jgi:hypothetical protein
MLGGPEVRTSSFLPGGKGGSKGMGIGIVVLFLTHILKS